MKLKLFGGRSDKAEAEAGTPKSERGIFGRKKKENSPESSRLSPGLSGYSVDMDALNRVQKGENMAPTSNTPPLLLKVPSDASSTNLHQLAMLTLADGNTGASRSPSEEEEATAASAMQAIAERAAELAAAAQGAKAHRAGCLALAGFGGKVVEVLAARAPLAAVHSQLDRVAVLLGNCTTLVGSCSGAAWLLVAASPEQGVCEAMAALHADILATLKDQGLDFVPGGLRLAGPDYRDGSRLLQRRLKQLGAGSLAAGLGAVARGEEEQLEVASMLGCQAEEVKRSASYVVEASLVGGDTAATAAGDEAVVAHCDALRRLFASYACFGVRDLGAAPELDSFRCAKLVREAGLLGVRLRAQELDVLFATAARQGGNGRKLSFEGFLKLLALLADKKRVSLGEVVGAVSVLEGPSLRATTPEHVKLHDDKSTYTGVYARGMSVADDSHDLGRMVNRDAAEKASRRASLPGSRRATPTPHIRAFENQEDEEAPAAVVDPPIDRTLHDMWIQFAAFGRSNATAAGGELSMDSAQFMKLCRDCGLLSRTLNSTRVDLVFRSTASKGTRRITYKQFCACLPRLAESRGCKAMEVARLVVASGGPSTNNTTTPEAVHLSDKSNFSGIAARGGPSTVEKDRITLAGMCDRSGRRTSLAQAE